MKKKICFIIPSLRGGGAEKVIVNILRYINKSIFDITLIVINKEGYYEKLLPKNITTLDLKRKKVRHSLPKLIKTLNIIRPDIVLSTQAHLNIGILLLKPFIMSNPKIIVREANTPSISISHLNHPKKEIITFLYKKLYKNADLIIAQCEDMKLDIVNFIKIPEEKIKVIYNPLDISSIKKEIDGRSPFQEGRVNFLSVGRLSFQKGFDILLEAFKLVIEKVPIAHLTILGEGNLEENLKKQTVDLGINKHVTFEGFKESPYNHYYHSDTYVLSSRWEGFPNTLLEALACDTKVVATNCKSGPKEILLNNEYGLLAEVENPSSLAINMLKSLKIENRSKNRASFYDIHKIIKDYESVFHELSS